MIAALLQIEKAVNPISWSEASFQQELHNSNSVFRVAILEHQPVGYCACWLVIDEAHIINVAVSPEHQRRGFGRQLVESVLATCMERGASCATLEVRASNEPAIHLYESLGFTRAAIRKRYYSNNAEDALVLWNYDLSGKPEPKAKL